LKVEVTTALQECICQIFSLGKWCIWISRV